jgi:hypothetical protein
MDRRTFLAGGVAAAGTALAGCGGVGTVTLDSPEKQADDDGDSTALVYRHDGDYVADFGVAQRRPQDSPGAAVPLRVGVPHSDDTTIESLRVDVRSPADSAAPNVYLYAPQGTLWSGLSLGRAEGGWTRIDFPDPGELGEGTITLELLVDPVDPVERLLVRGLVSLSASALPGRTYRIEPQLEFPLAQA